MPPWLLLSLKIYYYIINCASYISSMACLMGFLKFPETSQNRAGVRARASS